MATFRLVASGTLDTTQPQFVFEVVGIKTYLRFGSLNADDRRLLASIIGGGYVGFFDEGREIANARILEKYSTNGIRVESVPSALSIGSDYEIQWTQARPGETPEATALAEQGIVRFSTAEGININAEAQMAFDYRVIDAFYTDFEVEFYANANDYNTRRPIPEGDPKYPQGIRIEPATPFAAPGHYVHDLYFTPTYAGYLRVLLRLIESEATDRDLFQLVDIDGNRLVDIDGNVLVGEASPTYVLVDSDGNRLVDADGNSLIGFL